ncbi:cysteine-rich venom protein 6 [Malaya genurostris]|uniref:cysteine-rich venom protein 6 n=1 Tax=Malaya genurostris TaxID=325434 RepID=UPI0026F40199|nr:cysteine-rich venom protein 6 [Malaya genurostris]
MSTAMKLIIVAVCISAINVAALKICPKNEKFSTCGTRCEATCSNLSPICTDLCKVGCFCIPNFVRNANGVCTSIYSCPTPTTKQPEICPKPSVYSDCGSPCEATCRVPNPGLCITVCKKGCFCPSGYLRNDVGKCVLPSKCP